MSLRFGHSAYRYVGDLCDWLHLLWAANYHFWDPEGTAYMRPLGTTSVRVKITQAMGVSGGFIQPAEGGGGLMGFPQPNYPTSRCLNVISAAPFQHIFVLMAFKTFEKQNLSQQEAPQDLIGEHLFPLIM